jgi:hypothetical protein
MLIAAPDSFGQGKKKSAVCSSEKITTEELRRCLPDNDMPAADKRAMVNHVIKSGDPNKNIFLLQLLLSHLSGGEIEAAIKVATSERMNATKLLNDLKCLEHLSREQRSLAVRGACKTGIEIPEQAFENTPYQSCEEALAAEQKKSQPPKVPPPPKEGFGYSSNPTLPSNSLDELAAGGALGEPSGSGEGKLRETEEGGENKIKAAVKSKDSKALIALLADEAEVPASLRKEAMLLLKRSGPNGIRALFVFFSANMKKEDRQKLLETYISRNGDLKLMLEEAPLHDEEAELLVESAPSPSKRKELSKINVRKIK